LSIDTVLDAKEVFCSGTGASVTPVGTITHKGKKVVFNNGEVGPLSQALYNALLDIQLERTPDKHGWLFRPWK
jgi:branched-chain amino acid aminotransferase